jgi:hypothetical protein
MIACIKKIQAYEIWQSLEKTEATDSHFLWLASPIQQYK